MDSRLILVVIGVIAMAIGRSEAISCYACNSVTDNRCLDPFNSNGVSKCQGATCTKAWATSSGVTVVIRDCSVDAVTKDECADVTVSGVKSKGCVCSTDLCNDGQLVKPTLYNVLIGVAMATVTAIGWMNQI